MSRTALLRLLLVTAVAFGCAPIGFALAQSAHSAKAKDVAQVRAVLKATWDKPGQPVLVDPVVTMGDHGVAGWTQGDRGGRALLLRRGHDWKVIACGGDGLKSADALKQTGMPPRIAEALAQSLASAEAKLPPKTLGKFSSFDGVVRMDAVHGGGHK